MRTIPYLSRIGRSKVCFSMLLVSGNSHWGVGEKKLARMCLCVCLCVQAFWHVAPKRLDRSGRGWHRSMHRSGGTMMVPVAGRSAPRVTCHVAPRKPLHEICCQGCRSNGGRPGFLVCRSHDPHCEPRSFVVSVPEGCTAHVPGAENVFDEGSSGSGKL